MFSRRSAHTVLGACGLLALFALSEATAQGGIAALVNEEPVSNYDVAQRLKLLEATGQKSSRKEVLGDLIEERIKFQEARKLKVSVEEADVDKIFGSIAERVKMNPTQLGAALTQLGANPKTLKTRIRADLAWRKVVQAKLRGSIRIREADVIAALETRNKAGKGQVTEYNLAQIVYVIPKAAKGGGSRTAAAENMRARFVSCAQTLPQVRGLKDVVVKELGRKRSDELSEDLRKMLESTPENKLTKPNVTPTGIELVAVCQKRTVADDNAGEKKIRNDMMSDEMQEGAKKLMTELRDKAMVEMR